MPSNSCRIVSALSLKIKVKSLTLIQADDLNSRSDMNTRARFLEIMNFNPKVHSIKYEFGYWGETVDNWYSSGLPKIKYPVVSKAITTPASSLYSSAWTCQNSATLPKGIA